jgi:hypothetical protein
MQAPIITKPNRRKFLANDLKEIVDIQQYSQPLPVEDKKAMSMEWDSEDVQGFYKTIKSYNSSNYLWRNPCTQWSPLGWHTKAKTV